MREQKVEVQDELDQEPGQGGGEEELQGPDGQGPSVEELEARIRELTDERDKLQEQLLRTMADFQNARKRAQQEGENIRLYATEQLVTKLLPVLDNFERTIAALDGGAAVDSVAEGIRAVDRQFRSILEGVAVTRIKSHGQPFDPEVHEAVALEASNEHPEDTVIDEIEAGYRMADKVIRPARVRVAKKP